MPPINISAPGSARTLLWHKLRNERAAIRSATQVGQEDNLDCHLSPSAVTVLVVLHDAWFYWTHKIMHHPRLFRWFHRLHHRSQNPSPWTSYAFDASEAAVNAIYLPLALLLMPTSLLAAFLFVAHMMLRNAVGHCGYEVFPARRDGRPLVGRLATVTHHDLHHARPRWNLGLYFTWWDRLMGIEDPTYHTMFARAVGMSDEGGSGGIPDATRPRLEGMRKRT